MYVCMYVCSDERNASRFPNENERHDTIYSLESLERERSWGFGWVIARKGKGRGGPSAVRCRFLERKFFFFTAS